ncbi:enoyl-CoA hydratase/isomerase family protein [Zoogloea sp.]|uniref:enoyl-CoA hydratase/isomerase family protein n=1 Tax=Zoogloea sp. TaxID=49181 RepID=UPI0035B154DC
MTSPILLDVADGVATLTLNRPKALNALSFEMMHALSDATAKLARRDDLRVVVVQGAGDHFMAGGDLKDFASQLHLSPESRMATFRATIEQHVNRSVEAFANLRVPVIGRVHGACAGYGLSLALGCDMVVAADNAYFTTAYASIGLSGDGGVSWLLPRIVGRHKAFELLLLADRFDASEALRLGVANKVVPLDELDTAVAALVGRFLRGPRETYAEMKRLLNQAPDQSLDAQLQLEAEAFARCAARPDFDEGVNAFFEKRKARFGG